jgi:hypothetical protein
MEKGLYEDIQIFPEETTECVPVPLQHRNYRRDRRFVTDEIVALQELAQLAPVMVVRESKKPRVAYVSAIMVIRRQFQGSEAGYLACLRLGPFLHVAPDLGQTTHLLRAAEYFFHPSVEARDSLWVTVGNEAR